MKSEQEVRKILINNTIRVIAEGGFEKATTRAIAFAGEAQTDVKMNEAYIYRLFGSKEQLYEAAFSYLDKEIALALYSLVKYSVPTEGELEINLRDTFWGVWRYILDNEIQFRYYTRYYYSVYFRSSSADTHNETFKEIISAFTPFFRDDADVKTIMHSVYASMLGFAVRFYNKDLADTPENAERIYNILYRMLVTYLRK